MKVLRLRPSRREPADGAIFRGRVLSQQVIGEDTSDRHRVVEVTFTDGARTKLHQHTK